MSRIKYKGKNPVAWKHWRAIAAAKALGAKILERREVFFPGPFPLDMGPFSGFPESGKQNGSSGLPRRLGHKEPRLRTAVLKEMWKYKVHVLHVISLCGICQFLSCV